MLWAPAVFMMAVTFSALGLTIYKLAGALMTTLARHPQINVQYRVADDYTILNMVESRLGVSILPEAVLRRSGQRLTARRLSPELQRTIGVIYKQKTGLSTAGQLFLSELKASNPAPHG